jgi:hypothetical protein
MRHLLIRRLAIVLGVIFAAVAATFAMLRTM